MNEPVIKVRNVSKKYRVGSRVKRSDTLLGKITDVVKSPWSNFQRLRAMSRITDDDENFHWAVRNINFEVRQGEVLGIIGHNGAGKSTLLKILSRITPPSAGEIEITGRVSSLLEVGTGFHQELTGRDNIYMNGTIHGMRKKEIDDRLDEIIEFSGIEKYIDTPVKFYSSGMKMRLGFAVAAHLEPEILVIDEVLAVGDAEFQRKCLMKMDDVSKGGRTVLFVSHDMSAISKICPVAMLLNKGEIKSIGNTRDIINDYLNISSRQEFPNLISDEAIEVHAFDIDIGDDTSKISVKYSVKAPVKDLYIGFVMADSQGYNFFRTFDLQEAEASYREKGDYTSTFSFNTRLLSPGKYSLKFNIMIHRVRWICKENPTIVFEIPYSARMNDLNIDGLLYQTGLWEVK